MIDLHETDELLRATGLSLRRVQRAQERGELTPEVPGTQGRGRKTQWSIRDFVVADVYRDLTDAGIAPAATRPILEYINGLDGLKGNPAKNQNGLLWLHPDDFPAFIFYASGKVWAHDEQPTPERLMVLRSGVFVTVDLHMYLARLALFFDVRQVEPAARMGRLCSQAATSPAFGRAVYSLVREAVEDGTGRLLAFLGVKPKTDAALMVRYDVLRLNHEFEDRVMGKMPQ